MNPFESIWAQILEVSWFFCHFLLNFKKLFHFSGPEINENGSFTKFLAVRSQNNRNFYQMWRQFKPIVRVQTFFLLDINWPHVIFGHYLRMEVTWKNAILPNNGIQRTVILPCTWMLPSKGLLFYWKFICGLHNGFDMKCLCGKMVIFVQIAFLRTN